MGNGYRHHGPFNQQWNPNPRPRGPFQWGNRPPRHFGPQMTSEVTEEHWCETCDRGFPTLELLDRHKQQHQKCNIDGCQFVAHPKVITKHIQMQHSTGLYKKISKLDNPEEIKKWREERKKKYPTKVNIEKKAAECKEKIERGEKMALNNHRNNSRATGNNMENTHNYNKRPEKRKPLRTNVQNMHFKDPKTRPPCKKIPKTVPVTEEKSKLKPFSGIMSLVFDDDVNDSQDTCHDNMLIEDDDYEKHEVTLEKSITEPAICGALTSLMCEYGSSDEDEDHKGKDTEHNLDKTKNCARDLDKTTYNLSNQTSLIAENSSTTKKYKLHEKVDYEIKHTTSKAIQNNNISIVGVCHNKSDDEGSVEVKVIKDKETGVNNPQNDMEGSKSDDEGPVEVKAIKDIETAADNSHNEMEGFKSDDEGPKEVKVIKNNDAGIDNSYIQNQTSKLPPPKKKNIPHRNEQKRNYMPKHKIPSTLLQKLLSKEIRQERNIVLQCIRHIRKNNYFDKITD